jgi:hypothetical protein
MSGKKIHRFGLFVVVAVLVSVGAKCNPSELEKAVASIAKAQGVSESSVARSLDDLVRGRSDAEKLAMARQMKAKLPVVQVPDLMARLKSVALTIDEDAKGLQSVTCSAVLDVLASGKLPTPAEFVESYVKHRLGQYVPEIKFAGIAEEWQKLYDDAAAGELTAARFRLSLMQHQYC